MKRFDGSRRNDHAKILWIIFCNELVEILPISSNLDKSFIFRCESRFDFMNTCIDLIISYAGFLWVTKLLAIIKIYLNIIDEKKNYVVLLKTYLVLKICPVHRGWMSRNYPVVRRSIQTVLEELHTHIRTMVFKVWNFNIKISIVTTLGKIAELL